LLDAWNVLKEVHALFDGHIEHVSNVLALVANFERFPVYSASPRRPHTARNTSGKKMHLDLYDSVTPARLAAAAFSR